MGGGGGCRCGVQETFIYYYDNIISIFEVLMYLNFNVHLFVVLVKHSVPLQVRYGTIEMTAIISIMRQNLPL